MELIYWVAGGWVLGWLTGKISAEVIGWSMLPDIAWVRIWCAGGGAAPLMVASRSPWALLFAAAIVGVLVWAWHDAWREYRYSERLQDFNSRYWKYWNETESAWAQRVPYKGLPQQYRRQR